MTKFENATASTVRSFFAAFGSRAATVLGLTALFLLPFTFLVKPTPAAATTAQIEVTTGAFKGGWAIGSPSPKSFGPATIELETGQQHTVFVGTIGHFTINVDGNGDVTVLNGVSAQGGMGTLDFDTLEISVDPGLFPGRWIFSEADDAFHDPGIGTVDLVPGITYAFAPGAVASSIVTVNLQGVGTVTLSDSRAGTGGAQSVSWNTVPVIIDPVDFVGEWRLIGVVPPNIGSSDFVVGGDQANLIPGFRYLVGFSVNSFDVIIDLDGTIRDDSLSSSPDVDTAGNQVLRFDTRTVQIDPASFIGKWAISRVPISDDQFGFKSGPGTAVLVPELTGSPTGPDYVLFAGNEGQFGVSLAADGQVTVSNGISGEGEIDSLTFNNTTILVSPSESFTQTWDITFVTDPVVGPQEVVVVPGVLRYNFKPLRLEKVEFTVTEPCAVDPTHFTFGPSDQFSADIICGPLDSDGDGVPNLVDNCIDDPNPDQVDQDLDGLGNVCDLDLDGDSIANNIDNCPDLANLDQEDLDGDGLGDVCDADIDGDVVADAEDNCPLVPNTDQANNDGDLEGDVCDSDDDNDEVLDVADNCPLIGNFDQLDFDDDGEGDACDGDQDGDNVANELDNCPLSPLNEAVNDDGCTGPQIVEFRCVQEEFVQHGQFVSCVAHAANEAVSEGLLLPKEKSRFVTAAARSKK